MMMLLTVQALFVACEYVALFVGDRDSAYLLFGASLVVFWIGLATMAIEWVRGHDVPSAE